jgi:hypothetical protein
MRVLGELDSRKRKGAVSRVNFDILSDAHHEGDEGVFADVAEFVEGVERVIPSLVTIEAPKQRLDIREQFFASTPHAVVEIGGGIPERKGDVTGVGMTAGREMRRKRGVVETGSSVFDNFGSQDAPSEGKSLSDLDFVDLVSAIGIRLSDGGVWLFTEKLRNLGFEVLKVFLCPRTPDLRTVKNRGILDIHGERP